eukprot:5505098-Karenia_brevis.AAC.1
MATHKLIEEAKVVLHKHFDDNFYGVDVSHMATSDIWASWSSHELAKDVECALPASKDFQSH